MTNVPSSAHVVLLIPVWRPERRLIDLVQSLRSDSGLVPLVVLDGLEDDDRSIIAALEEIEGLQLLRHPFNRGKGRALKTGFNWVLDEAPGAVGVVTADADGQHLPKDILSVAAALEASPDRFVLGSRAFDQKVPLRSRIGNAATRLLFWLLTGHRVRDTQTGLRGIPTQRLPELLQLDGERYEYEMNMLSHLCRSGFEPLEVPITTVYIESNRSSHFDPLRDSARIYLVLLRSHLPSLCAAGLDFAGFALAFGWTHSIPIAVVAGRILSLANALFERRGKGAQSALGRDCARAMVLGGVSYAGIRILYGLEWNVLAAKIATEAFLALAMLTLQRVSVFAPSKQAV